VKAVQIVHASKERHPSGDFLGTEGAQSYLFVVTVGFLDAMAGGRTNRRVKVEFGIRIAPEV
jgi:hypothetical protein